jgi:hypothetical protein
MAHKLELSDVGLTVISFRASALRDADPTTGGPLIMTHGT